MGGPSQEVLAGALTIRKFAVPIRATKRSRHYYLPAWNRLQSENVI
jgi:hypothetical protein